MKRRRRQAAAVDEPVVEEALAVPRLPRVRPREADLTAPEFDGVPDEPRAIESMIDPLLRLGLAIVIGLGLSSPALQGAFRGTTSLSVASFWFGFATLLSWLGIWFVFSVWVMYRNSYDNADRAARADAFDRYWARIEAEEEAARIEAARIEAARLEAERLEAARLVAEERERQRLETEQAEAERLAAERAAQRPAMTPAPAVRGFGIVPSVDLTVQNDAVASASSVFGALAQARELERGLHPPTALSPSDVTLDMVDAQEPMTVEVAG
jgi:signal transduction histidine kinase